jgi:hypothetical protein
MEVRLDTNKVNHKGKTVTRAVPLMGEKRERI